MKKYLINSPWRNVLNVGVAVILAACTSCENFVDIPGPEAELPAEIVFEDAATADAALAHIYTSLQSRVLVTGDVTRMSILMGAYSDELVSYSNYGLPEETFFVNNLQADNATVASLWSDSYSLIYAANAVLEGVAASQSLSGSDRDRLSGEALFLRSYIYSYLVQLFGDIPYVTGTDYTVNKSLPRTGSAKMYTRLIADLELAESRLADDYYGSGRARPSKSAAAALLARVSLLAGDYALAADKASQVINNTAQYTISPDLDNVFLIGSPGIIWQLAPAAPTLNTLEGQNFIFSSAPPPERALSAGLMAAFEPGDLRRDHWIATVTDGTDTWYHPFKYKQAGPTGASQEYSVQLRIEEMYLIRAEARAHSGDIIGAKDDIDVIRLRAGLPGTAANDTASLLNAVLRERRVEFFTELGHRFFDLKRFGAADAFLLPVKPGWNAFDITLPIPLRELQLNPNLLPQNQGY